MTNKELENELAKKIQEIKDLYYKEYPNGDYMTFVIFKDTIGFHNRYQDEDSSYPINYYHFDSKGEIE